MRHPTRMSLAVATALGLLAATLTACGDGNPDGSQSRDSKDAAARDGYAQLESMIGEDGEVTKQDALDGFALAFGSIPGADAPPNVDPPMLLDEPIMWVLRYRDELTAEQKRAIGEKLFPDPLEPTETTEETATSSAAGRAKLLRPATDVATYERWAEEFRTEYESRMGVHLSLDIDVHLIPAPRHATGAYAVTDPVASAFGRSSRPDTCLIQIAGDLDLHRRGAGAQRPALAHEVFHCFQYDLYPGEDPLGVATDPDWVHEGAATWAGEALFNGSRNSSLWWDSYLAGDGGGFSLFSSAYSAIGWYGNAEALGVDLWHNLANVLRAISRDSGPLYQIAASGASSNMLVEWGPSPLQHSSWGQLWVARGPGVQYAHSRRDPERRTVSGTLHLGIREASNKLFTVSAADSAAVMTLGGSGFGAYRWGDAGAEQRFDGSANARWCVDGTCTCPDGTDYPGGPYARPPRGGTELWIGMASGGSGGAELLFQTRTRAQLCEEETTTTTAPSGDLRADVSGPNGGTFTGDGYCTAQHAYGGYVVQIGHAQGRYFSIVAPSPPTVPGPQSGGMVQWGDPDNPIAIGANRSTVVWNADLRSGSFSGLASVAKELRTEEASGTFSCGSAGESYGSTREG